jgi:Rrf2 family protein
MSASTRLAVATHVLAALALAGGRAVSSELIAHSVSTNPAFIRRLLASMARAGLTTSQLGTGGGALLARSADEITLLDVHHAVDEPPLLGVHHGGPNLACPLGKNILPILDAELAAATSAFERSLARTTIADVARRITVRAGKAAIDRLLGM